MQYLLSEREIRDLKFGIYRPENLIKFEKSAHRKVGEKDSNTPCIVATYNNGKNGITIVFGKEELEIMLLELSK